jgi:hypothetical protein
MIREVRGRHAFGVTLEARERVLFYGSARGEDEPRTRLLMKREVSEGRSKRRRRMGEAFCVGGLFVLGACSSGGGDNTGFVDSGSADAGNRDATTKSDATMDASPDMMLINLDTGAPDTSPTDSHVGSETSAEGGFSFDGFGYPDGFSADSADCPDDDGDGFTVCDGDCDDHNSLVNPCAFDTNAASGDPVGSDGLDNDCDGVVDNLRTCDGSLTPGHDTSAADYASASDICDNQATAANPQGYCQVVKSATWYGPNNSSAHRITKHMGTHFTPKLGSTMTFLSTGVADDDTDTPSYRTGDGTDLGNTFTNPYPFTAAENMNPCGVGTAETATKPAVHDYSELQLSLRAPRNASGFSFKFNFFSEEYPVYVCAGFNDHFLALLTSKKYPSTFQIAFDGSGHPIDVNNSFFTDCTSMTTALTKGFAPPGYNHTCTGALSLLTGTSYEIPYSDPGGDPTLGNDNYGSGATDWLTTTAPISAGETFTLSFVVFDEQDGILDSAVNVDSFQWTSTPVPSPVTAR